MIFIEHDILKYRPEAQRLENVRFALGREVDRLRVAAAFDVEDALIAPNVFVVANEMTFWICRQRGFPRATETEKQRRHACLFIGCGRAMHREQPALRRKVIGHCEHAFLHFTRVFGAEDNKLLVLEAEIDGGGRAHSSR
jgi:hypothetical protein